MSIRLSEQFKEFLKKKRETCNQEINMNSLYDSIFARVLDEKHKLPLEDIIKLTNKLYNMAIDTYKEIGVKTFDIPAIPSNSVLPENISQKEDKEKNIAFKNKEDIKWFTNVIKYEYEYFLKNRDLLFPQEDSIACGFCGKKEKNITRHLYVVHGIKPDSYKKIFGLPYDMRLDCINSQKIAKEKGAKIRDIRKNKSISADKNITTTIPESNINNKEIEPEKKLIYLTSEQIVLFYSMIDQDISIDDIIDYFKIEKEQIFHLIQPEVRNKKLSSAQKYCQLMNIDIPIVSKDPLIPRWPHKEITPEQAIQFYKMIDNGISKYQAAKEWGIDYSNIPDWIKNREERLKKAINIVQQKQELKIDLILKSGQKLDERQLYSIIEKSIQIAIEEFSSLINIKLITNNAFKIARKRLLNK
jgi:hypothetical protein